MRRRALLIGINKYRNLKAELRGCVNDITHARELLEDNYGYAPLDITTLLDDQGTATAIRSEFERLIQYVLEGDRAVLWFSGHGTQVYTPDASEADQLAEAVVPWETDFDSLIQDKWFGQLLDKVVARGRAANITLLFDCCHSGTITREFKKFDSDIDVITRNRFFPITEMQKVVPAPLEKIHAKARGFRGLKSIQPGPWDVISACQDEQTAADTYLGGEFRGSLSYALIKMLQETPLLTYSQMELRLKSLMKELVPTHTQEVALEVRNMDQTFLELVNPGGGTRSLGYVFPTGQVAPRGFSGEFTAYAGPNVFGPWVDVASHIGRATFTISAEAVGSTVLTNEVKFYDSTNTLKTQGWTGSVRVSCGDSVANVSVRFRGTPFGSAVRGTVR